jgi:hypothetical protein
VDTRVGAVEHLGPLSLRERVRVRGWTPFKPIISDILTRVLSSELRDHMNWNIENLVFDKERKKLHYVDLKPSTMFARSANEHNIAGIKDVFL